jgi:alginate O-acetyltransferase complex protein AlgI
MKPQMLFNSLPFAAFFVVFFLLYWFVFNKDHKLQNIFLLVGSYVFYAWWDWRFLFLLIGSSALNFFLGLEMGRTTKEKYRNVLVCVGLLQCLGSLIFFKYVNFFIKSLIQASAAFNVKWDIYTVNLLLPLGISFYTFRIIAYLLDIKKGSIKPNTDWVVFFSYIAFFPCIISGPIDRPKTMMPQLEKKRIFDYNQAVDGMRQILWGLFKKIVIADNCAGFTSTVFDHYRTLPASSLLFGAFLATIQIYADFSGYSDMAIGFSNLIGFRVTRNFNTPFFSQNIAEYWRRWHISLTSWLTDYVFTPLSIYFRDYGKAGLILAILINFTLIGIWHGANWTFVLFGFLNGCYYIPLILRGTINRKQITAKPGSLPSIKTLANMAGTFILVMFTLVLFRSATVGQAFQFYGRLFSRSLFSMPVIAEKVNIIATLFFIVVLFTVEWIQKNRQHALQIDFIERFAWRALIYYSLIFFILFFSATKSTDFIYIKF